MIGLPPQPVTGLSAGMARAIRAINDGLNEGICASPRKPLKDMTTRDALIEDMARTDDAAACLLSYDADARGSAPRVPARTFERTAPVASESRRPQVPAAGNSTRYEPTAETAYQPAEYYDDAHAVADEVGAQCERYAEYDAHDYSGRDYQDSYQLRGRKLWAAVAILALAMIGTAGAYSYRTMFGGEGQQQTAKIASVTANGDKQIQERLADRSTGERVVSREEQSLAASERKRVRTVTMGPKGGPADAAPAPTAAAPRAAVPATPTPGRTVRPAAPASSGSVAQSNSTPSRARAPPDHAVADRAGCAGAALERRQLCRSALGEQDARRRPGLLPCYAGQIFFSPERPAADHSPQGATGQRHLLRRAGRPVRLTRGGDPAL